ncbi:MAG: cytochrome c3 family protein [Vulcanimicrobiota bacterium]
MGSPQIFPAWVDEWLGAVVLGLLLALGLGIPALWTYAHSDYVERTHLAPEQPVQFSHRHHVAEVGLDCRYCHSTVETGASAGMPASTVCLTCHSQLYAGNDPFAPLRHSYASGEPLHWRRVYRLPDYVYFDHSIHLAKGVSCVECHGRVDQMALVQLQQPLTMEFCLDCHKQPGGRLRSQSKLFELDSPGEPNLLESYHIRQQGLTDCSVCHR